MRLIYFVVIVSVLSCTEKPEKAESSREVELSEDSVQQEKVSSDTVEELSIPKQASTHDTDFVSLDTILENVSWDMKYATADNFLNEKVYDCPKCVLRYEVAKALKQANIEFMEKGYKLRFFDCYRPLSIQKKMWEIYPDGRYVANPNKSASIHNRGAAVDVSLLTLEGDSVNMGTTFDHFGKEAHHAYTSFEDSTVLENRELLKEVMINHNFAPLATEWWHYNFKSDYTFEPSDFPIKCD